MNKTYLFYLLPLISLGISAFLFKNKDGESLLLSFDFLGNILGALVGGLLAFWIAYIQIKDQRKQQDEQRQDQIKQQDDQRKLEIKKMKAELEIQNLEFQDELLRDLYSALDTFILTYIDEEIFKQMFDGKVSHIRTAAYTKIKYLYPAIKATVIDASTDSNANVKKLISKLEIIVTHYEQSITKSNAEDCKELISKIFEDNSQSKRKAIDSIQK